MSDQKRDDIHGENDHRDLTDEIHEETDVVGPEDELFPEDAEQRNEEDNDLDTEGDDVADDEEDDVAEIPRFARLSGWLGFLLPPVGAIMGHLWLAWEGKDKDTPGRRHAVTGVIIGWFLTFVLGVTGLIAATLWFEAAEETRVQESRAAIAQEELAAILTAAEDSPATGVIDAPTCDAIFAVVNPETPPEDLDALVGSYEAIAAGETPNAESYAGYAEYLGGFDSAEELAELDEDGVAERTENAATVLEALDEDSLGCVALDENYFLDNVANRNTMEY